MNPISSPRKMFWDQFCQHRAALMGLAVIIFFLMIAVSADLLSLFLNIDPSSTDILNRYAPPSLDHWLGTDEAGRDVLLRLIYGTRISLMVAICSAISSAFIGIIAGSIAGYFGGLIDTVIMRIVDSMLALPLIPVLIILAAVDFGKLPILSTLLNGEDSSVLKMILILMVFSWMIQARLVRGAILKIRNQDFVLAAQTLGMSPFSIIVKEILPNILSPVIVSVTLNIGSAILFEAALSFLGLGIAPPIPSWGNMLNNAQEIIYEAPHLAILPGLLILIVVVSFNFLGDGLQDALDPKLSKQRS